MVRRSRQVKTPGGTWKGRLVLVGGALVFLVGGGYWEIFWKLFRALSGHVWRPVRSCYFGLFYYYRRTYFTYF